jgi:hypothetical protein
MQYTSKIALLAVALFGTSALAAPFAAEAEFYDVEAREVDNDLSARELFELYLEARANPSLDARDLESLDLEAREYLEYLEARAAATTTTATTTPEPPQTPQTPLSPQSKEPQSKEHTLSSNGNPDPSRTESKQPSDLYVTPHQKSVRLAKQAAAKEFEDPKVYQAALADKTDPNHRYAVSRYLTKPDNMKTALANNDSPYHKAAKRILRQNKAKAYLEDKRNLKKALKSKHHKYHKDAVKMYFSHGDHFETALANKKSPFHKAAVKEYLLDTDTRKSVLADPSSPYYKQAKKLEKKISKHQSHVKVSSSSAPANSTSTPNAATTKA